MSLNSAATKGHLKNFRWWPELILVALVTARVALGILADRVGGAEPGEPASTIGWVAWDDRTGGPVVLAVRPEPRQAQSEETVAQQRAAF